MKHDHTGLIIAIATHL